VTFSGQEDAHWRRPPGEPVQPEQVRPVATVRPSPSYAGPPRSVPPPPGWQPPVVVEPAPPRTLPAQDHEALDVQEQSARTLTIGIGMLAGAVMLVILLLVCGRALF
jgi:hypothetical protein